MFLAWSINIIIITIPQKIVKIRSGSLVVNGPIKNELIKTHVIDKIEDKDTIFVDKKTIKNIASSIKKQYGENANSIPVVQATPLPPLNLANIGKM